MRSAARPPRRLRRLLPLLASVTLLGACPSSGPPPRRTTAGPGDPPTRHAPGASPRRRSVAGAVRDLVEVEGNRFGVGLCVLRTSTARCGAVVSADPKHPPRFKVIPRPVKRLSGVITVAPAGDHHCDLKTDGSVWCRGQNSRGQLGLGHRSPRRRPQRVGGLGKVVSLATGWRATCAATTDGRAWCWGNASSGQAGDGGRVCAEDDDGCAGRRVLTRPTAVVGLTGVRQVYAAYGFACALKADRTLWCWGANDQGQLGTRSAKSTARPRPVVGLSDVVDVALGTNKSCAVTRAGHLYCWPGPKGARRRRRPKRVASLAGVTAVSVGSDHRCAVAHGLLWCWGDNQRGQLGDGTQTRRAQPVQVKGLSNVRAVLGLTASTCAARADGTLWCWGAMGQRRLGKREQVLTPRRVRLIGK